MSKSISNAVLRPVSKMSGLQKCIYLDPLFLLEGKSSERPATSYSSPAPGEILPLDVLRSTVSPAKS